MSDDGRTRAVDDPIQQALGAAIDIGDLLVNLLSRALDLGEALVPRVVEQRLRQIDELGGRLRLLHDVREGSFHPCGRHGLVLGLASAGHAAVVGVVLILALGPAAGHSPPAAITDHEAAQREVLLGVLSRRGTAFAAAIQNILNGLEGLKADQTLMAAFAQRDAPRVVLDVAGVKDLAQQAADRHQPDRSVLLVALGEERVGFQKSRHFRLGPKAAGCKPFECVAHYRTKVLVDNEHMASTGCRIDVAVAYGTRKHPEAAFQLGPHLLRHLTGILRMFQFTLSRHNGFDELPLRSVFETEVQALHRGASLREFLAKFQMEQSIASEALQIIESDDIRLALMSAEVGQRRPHPGTLHEIAFSADIIREDGYDFVAAFLRVGPTAMHLAFQATPIGFLLL